MKKRKLGVFALILLLLAFSAFAERVSSANYKQNVIVSEGGESTSSSSYDLITAIGIINSVITSSSYINKLGFFHTILLADGQPCTSANQCEGGFCCSSICKSSSCPSGGGGGGGAAAAAGVGGNSLLLIKNFSISPASIYQQLALGATNVTPIMIKNTGNFTLDFILSASTTVNELISLSETTFSLAPTQEKIVDATLTGKKIGSYFGSIDITGDSIQKSIDVVIDVQSQQALFDAKIDIPLAYKEVEAGKELKAQVTLINIGPAKTVDVSINYLIKDKSGNAIHESSEILAVEKQVSFVKSFSMPENAQPGDYILTIEVRYQNSFAVSSDLFKVVKKEEAIKKFAVIKTKTALMTISFSVVVLVLLFLYLLIPKIRFSDGKLEKCLKAISDAKEAIAINDIYRAKELYNAARSIYVDLETKGKREIYEKLMWLYNTLKNR